MKKKSGKKFFFILLFLMVTPLVVAFFILHQNMSSDLYQGSLSGVSIFADGKETLLKEKEDVDFFVSLVTSGEEITSSAHDLGSYRSCTVVFHKLRKDFTYQLYLSDSVNDCIYTDPDGNLFLISSQQVGKLYSYDVIERFAVSFAKAPSAALVQGGISFGPSFVEGEWTHCKPDGTERKDAISEQKESLVILPAGEAFSPRFSLAPDSCVYLLTGENFKPQSGPLSELKTLSLPEDTKLRLVLTCVWVSAPGKDYEGNAEYTFDVFYDVPASYEIEKKEARGGEAFSIQVLNTTSPTLAVIPTFSAGEVSVEKTEKGFSVIVPVSSKATPGEYSIMLMGEDVDFTISVSVFP